MTLPICLLFVLAFSALIWNETRDYDYERSTAASYSTQNTARKTQVLDQAISVKRKNSLVAANSSQVRHCIDQGYASE